MSGSMNRVTILGRLGRDPEVRTFQNGGKIVNLRIATSDTWKDRETGERKERTEWHSVVIHAEGLCRIAEQYLRKGLRVLIEGRLETRKWQDQSGQDRYSTEVCVRQFHGSLTILDRADDSGGSSGGDGYGDGYSPGRVSGPSDGYQRHDLDDDIPF